MSQMPQQAAVSKCPSCEEPLESGDRFCGACGYDLSAVPARPDDSPTIALNGAVPPPSSAPDGVDWPVARDSDGFGRPAPVHAAAEVPGTDSGGSPLPPHPPAAPPMPSAAPPMPPGTPPVPRTAPGPAAPGMRFDHPAGPEQEPVHGPEAGREDGREPDAYPREPDAYPREPDEYPLQAPDPRSAAAPPAPAVPPAPAAPAASEKVCVACRAGRVDDDGYCENCGHAQPRERDHMEQESGPVAAVSDRGLRHHRNEDAFSVGCTALPDGAPASVAIVCDGVSSATRPDDASLAASRAAGESLLAALPRGTHPQQAMHDAILAASHAVNALAEEPETAREQAPHQNAPACTLVGAVVTAGLLVVGWVGDSRVYWVPADRSAPPARLTEDDSWAAQMVAAGLMSEAEAYADERAHAITGWLGADAYELEPHTASFKPDRPGVVVVCTDGLWNYAESAEEMAEAVPLDAAARPLHSARVLVGHALDGGGHDNVTVALVPFPAPPQGAGSA
ncbi:protein phosphatase 2C domain-containing protein [Streptomyces sp. Babs14]|uniref:PP2C family serine/threonine-protein phosphatase n=1 Tax=unclassified Streptomyces TaxID=2593676 RepID=UPI001C23F118|nr:MULTISPECIES: PP2C family serine/threonine-protein phosphatase [unclassified Streptomyces]MBU8549737.1 protein phosphatase 2C domain-containing protein [Streptomyces sp. Osf17]MBU8556521.1 protein phosphatase 2C domain-containing protein [Streptomyces sp. Babs14]